MEANVKVTYKAGTYKAIVLLVFITILGCVSIHEPQYEQPTVGEQPSPTRPTVGEQPPPEAKPKPVTQLQQIPLFPELPEIKLEQSPPYPPPKAEERPNAEMQRQ